MEQGFKIRNGVVLTPLVISKIIFEKSSRLLASKTHKNNH